MSRKNEVAMKSTDESGNEIVANIMPSSVAAYERRGWTRVDDGSSETDPGTPGADDHQALTGTPPDNAEDKE